MENLLNSKLLVLGKIDNELYELEDGKVTGIGTMNDHKFHIECLLKYAEEHYGFEPAFDKFNFGTPVDLVIYVYTKILGDTLFLNWSTDKYKSGMLCLPDELSNKQRDTINAILKDMESFRFIVYDNFNIDEYEHVSYDHHLDLSQNDVLDIVKNIKDVKKHK